MGDELKPWQKRTARYVQALFEREEVTLEFESLFKGASEMMNRGEEDEGWEYLTNGILSFIEKHKIPRTCRVMLLNVVKTGVIDYTLIAPAISVISEPDEDVLPQHSYFNHWFTFANQPEYKRKPQVLLALGPTITREELEQFIADQWKTSIEPKLKLHGAKRAPIRTPLFTQRDATIYKLHTEGLTAPQISLELEKKGWSLEPVHIRKIIQREKQRRDT